VAPKNNPAWNVQDDLEGVHKAGVLQGIALATQICLDLAGRAEASRNPELANLFRELAEGTDPQALTMANLRAKVEREGP
jgi:hypothetical protein